MAVKGLADVRPVAAAGSEERPPRRVVVADDSPSLRTLLTTLLSLEPGFEVAGVAADGAEAVETVLRVRPDLLLLDLAMPRVDGLQVMEQLKDQLPELRIVVFSGYTSAELEQAARDRGAAAYVRKGRPPEDLIEALASVA